ncbi:hypothetical protein GQ54DRAFT_299558 [Martensiomyces pterosporus]|nr:hypothetical protein GQ54DRAFT_299558 [Martensiomyces pterosporus]
MPSDDESQASIDIQLEESDLEEAATAGGGGLASEPKDSSKEGMAQEEEPAKESLVDGKATMAATEKQQKNEAPADGSVSTEKSDASSVTLKQIYGIFCWLQMAQNNKQWQEQPMEACKRAVNECPHLMGANARLVKEKLDEIDIYRQEVVAKYGGVHNVPQDTRVIPGGPLFVIADFILSGQAARQLESTGACNPQIVANATGSVAAKTRSPPALDQLKLPSIGVNIGKPSNIDTLAARNAFTQLAFDAINSSGSSSSKSWTSNAESTGAFTSTGGSGPARHKRHVLHPSIPHDHPIMRRARGLTADEIRQMKDEMRIRGEIAKRDALLLADWTAMKRRHLEVKEKRLRELAAARSPTLEAMLEFQDFIEKTYKELQ